MTAESTLSTFTAGDGDNLALHDWPLPDDVKLRGVVLLVHGLGEHAGRYGHVAKRLNAWGFAVRGYDQHGHGQSGGARGSLPTDTRLLDDLADVMDNALLGVGNDTPLILLGHSLGGLIAARFVSLRIRAVQGLILSSPALDPGLSSFQKFLVKVLPNVVPDLRVGNGLNPELISHDPAVVKAYLDDPLVHDRISARLARFIAEAGPATIKRAPAWTVPTLLLYAGQDRLVSPAGSAAFAAAAPKNVVTAHCFEALYHELFNELDAQPVFEELRRWLDARF